MTVNAAQIFIADSDRWFNVGAPHHTGDGVQPLAARDTILVTPEVPLRHLLAKDPAGGWQIHPDLFWSLITPLDAGAPPRGDVLATGVWRGLAWWYDQKPEDRSACAGLCDRGVRGGAEMVAILDRLAAVGAPAGIGAVAPIPPAAPPALPPLADPVDLAAFMTDPEGLGAFYGPTFVPRDVQADLAASVLRALNERQALLAEAGPGTGKTLAYLLPLLQVLAGGDGRAVISTYSRALQNQILAGDLPLLLGPDAEVTARLLMGRGNYLCTRQRVGYLTRPFEEPREAFTTAAFRTWLLATTDGMREELTGHPLLAADCSSLFGGLEPCQPQCHEGGGCYVVRARRKARAARLVVVNHALLLHDHAAGHALIGPYDQLIVDEAHRLPAALLDARTVALGRWRLTDLELLLGGMRPAGEALELPALLAQRLGGEGGDLAAKAGDAALAFGKAANRSLRAYAAWWRAAGSKLMPAGQVPPGARVRIADKEITLAPVREETLALIAATGAAAAASATLNECTEELEETSDSVVDMLVRSAQAGELMRRLEQDIRFVATDPSDRWVAWMEMARRGGLSALGATPLESGPILRELWQDGHVAPVATSATLAVGDDFGFMLEELGLAGRRPPTATTAVPSPFDWHHQARILAPENFPAPDHPDFTTALTDLLTDLRREVPRQTLVLFTSYRQLQDVAAELGDEVLAQRPGSGTDGLRRQFRDSRGAMLLGTSTFWEGVDFPGESLEVLVVTRLPFQVPSDPWVEARCERLQAAGENPFTEFMVRDAVLRLRQGVGRLLRRRDDRGVVLLLDNRLLTRRYGATFRSALPATLHWLADHQQLAGAARDFLSESEQGPTP